MQSKQLATCHSRLVSSFKIDPRALYRSSDLKADPSTTVKADN